MSPKRHRKQNKQRDVKRRRLDTSHARQQEQPEQFDDDHETAAEISELLEAMESERNEHAGQHVTETENTPEDQQTTEPISLRDYQQQMRQQKQSAVESLQQNFKPEQSEQPKSVSTSNRRTSRPERVVKHKHIRRHFSWAGAWRRCVRFCTPVVLRAPWIALKRMFLYFCWFIAEFFSFDSSQIHNTYLVPERSRSASTTLSPRKQKWQPSLMRRITRRIAYWMPQPMYAVCLQIGRQFNYLRMAIWNLFKPIPGLSHNTWLVPGAATGSYLWNRSTTNVIESESEVSQLPQTEPTVEENFIPQQYPTLDSEQQIENRVVVSNTKQQTDDYFSSRQRTITETPRKQVVTTATVSQQSFYSDRKRRNGVAAWWLMAGAGIIGIILMLLQPFNGETTGLAIQPVAETPELQLQMSLWITPDEDEPFQVASRNLTSRDLPPVELSSFSPDLWDKYNFNRSLNIKLPQAYQSPLGIYEPTDLHENEKLLTVSSRSGKGISVIVEKEIPALVSLHQQFQYELHVRNLSDEPVEHLLVEENIPEPHRVVNVSPDAYYNGQTLRWEIEQLAGGETRRLVVSLLPMESGYIATTSSILPTTAIAFQTNIQQPKPKPTPSVFDPEPEPRQPLAEPKREPVSPIKPIPQPELPPLANWNEEAKTQLEVTAPRNVAEGELVTLTVKAHNRGDATARNVTVRYNVPKQLYCRTGNQLEWKIGELKPGDSETATITLRATQRGSITQQMELFVSSEIVQQKELPMFVNAARKNAAAPASPAMQEFDFPSCECECFVPY